MKNTYSKKSNQAARPSKSKAAPEAGLVRLWVSQLQASPENDEIYRPVSAKDPEIRILAKSIREHGLLEPLVVTSDLYVVSGPRRLAALKLARKRKVDCRVLDVKREDAPAEFVRLLREHNRQRSKSIDEKLRETVVDLSAQDCHERVKQQRIDASKIDLPAMKLGHCLERKEISSAKRPLLERVLEILEERKRFWPLSLRTIHYAMCNEPVLRHASKPRSHYQNDRKSYQDLSDLLTRARLSGEIPITAFDDETRPVQTWNVFAEPGQFIAKQLRSFMAGYFRDLMQSQPNQIEILGEKNTVAPILHEVAREFCVPYTIGRGFSSLPPRRKMAERYFASGKDKLILLILSDFDPEGETIAQSFARSMRDDFEIAEVHAVKVALTCQQVEERELPPSLEAKKGSATYKDFVQKFGTQAYELEALDPDDLQDILREAIESVIDHDMYNAELEAEEQDSKEIIEKRERVRRLFKG